jgi:predicted AAA+ superfamily ATPase
MQRNLEEDLKKWKTTFPRYPLLLRGARQVGKTYLVETFGKKEFDSFVSVNFEAQPEAIACFESLEPMQILMRLERILGSAIQPGKTLLFLDEIQACPKAIVALRYFKEKMESLHVIGAGSLMELALVQSKFSFPVGRVQFLYLKPLSFQEYMMARGKEDLAKTCAMCTLKNPPSIDLHNEMLQLVKEYFLIGGMPATASAFCKRNSLQECMQIQDILLSTYRADFSKYASDAEQRYLRLVFDGLPQTVGQQFKYSKIDPHIRSRELKNALDHLEWAGITKHLYATSAAGIPLSVQQKQTVFKMLFLDIGLLQRARQIDSEVVLQEDLAEINRGALAEQFVGQELIAYADPYSDGQLHYWQREKSGSDAEVDYLTVISSSIIPIEVKAGPTGRLKSLYQFIEEKKAPFGIRISQAPLSFKENLLSIPFYLIGHMSRIASSILKK